MSRLLLFLTVLAVGLTLVTTRRSSKSDKRCQDIPAHYLKDVLKNDNKLQKLQRLFWKQTENVHQAALTSEMVSKISNRLDYQSALLEHFDQIADQDCKGERLTVQFSKDSSTAFSRFVKAVLTANPLCFSFGVPYYANRDFESRVRLFNALLCRILTADEM